MYKFLSIVLGVGLFFNSSMGAEKGEELDLQEPCAQRALRERLVKDSTRLSLRERDEYWVSFQRFLRPFCLPPGLAEMLNKEYKVLDIFGGFGASLEAFKGASLTIADPSEYSLFFGTQKDSSYSFWSAYKNSPSYRISISAACKMGLDTSWIEGAYPRAPMRPFIGEDVLIFPMEAQDLPKNLDGSFNLIVCEDFSRVSGWSEFFERLGQLLAQDGTVVLRLENKRYERYQQDDGLGSLDTFLNPWFQVHSAYFDPEDLGDDALRLMVLKPRKYKS